MSENITFDVAADLMQWARAHGMDEERLSSFVQRNLETTTLVSEVWIKLLSDIPELTPTISLAKEHGKYNFFTLYTVCSTLADKLINHLDEHGTLPVPFQSVPAVKLLDALRYPKRMPLVDADWLVAEAKDKFFKMMDYCGGYRDNPDALLPQYSRDYPIIRQYKRLIHQWLDEILPPVWWFNEEVDPFAFSPGAVADACTNPFCKWFRAEHTLSSHGTLLPIPVTDPVAHRNAVEEYYRSIETTVTTTLSKGKYVVRSASGPASGTTITAAGDVIATTSITCPSWRNATNGKVLASVYAVKPITVPKQINSVRVVCPERAYNARLQNHIDVQLRKWWKKIHLDQVFTHGDQSVNRVRAWKGSIWNHIASIDSTAASDTNHRDLVYAIDHPTLNYLLTFMPQVVFWGSKVRWLEMFGTMGSPLTFDVEMIIFYIMARLGMVLADFGNVEDTAQCKPCDCGVTIVGDDLVVLSKYADCVLQIMETCHMIPNRQKTFIDGFYRESCGGEYMNGIDVSGTYWPRGLDVTDVANTRWDGWKEVYTSPLISLVSHQKALVKAHYDAAAEVVSKYIRSFYDTGFGCDPTGEWNDTILGTSLFQFEDQDGNTRLSSYYDMRPNEAVMLTAPVTVWREAGPKDSCWCKGVPQSVIEMLLDEWRYYSHDVYIEDDHGSKYSLPRVPHVHMRPRTFLDATRHN